MYPITLKKLKVGNNSLDSYLPVRNSNNNIDWKIVTGLVLSYALKHKIEAYDLNQFRDDCKTHLQELLDEPAFWSVLERMYFSSQDIFRVSPLFLLFHAQFDGEKISAGSMADKRLGTLFSNLMGDFSLCYPIQDKLNFIEQQILKKLDEKVIPFFGRGPFAEEQPYLPYMVTCFQSDLAFLAEHPQYLLQELTNTLRLYAFSWCAQLALNLDNWQDGEPQSKSLFFILDTEKASSEREKIKRYGYKLFSSQSEKLFPMLSALEVLQWEKGEKKRPLWQVYQDTLNDPDPSSQMLNALNDYLQEFIENRKLPPRERAVNLESAFNQLLSVAIEQFQDKKDRASVNRKYINELENQICADFIQVRGRAGKVLVLNQDRLLLLTNLTVGKNDKLRLHELLRGFEQRGFYLDNQSAQTLVAFYERMGNVERMSDSGDAVYVRKTV
ncbi:DNA phosphorothioation-dependent restriction protein DptG [Photorhabdus tasmaniensis]|uniref:DNA phosphorothioation-dependent restriction protein DptG n=1 Tax=Photorhabdus tasmaniensis TaxID=1004159 RepID=A0ABX0GJI7_9GAMM|nr:DNA phosphorothioation-dependent restriction protein DptG [Photorhabdus tasmaniensis]NHB88059.1 DNA phosphorothioation-dependent restriction protein DptG [Photorhabdus tasmaniensis]